MNISCKGVRVRGRVGHEHDRLDAPPQADWHARQMVHRLLERVLGDHAAANRPGAAAVSKRHIECLHLGVAFFSGTRVSLADTRDGWEGHE